MKKQKSSVRAVIATVATWVIGVGCANGSMPASDHFNGKTFFTPWSQPPKGFLDLIKWNWERKQSDWPKWVDDNLKPQLTVPQRNKTFQVSFINHSSFYIQTQTVSFLIDPVFSERVSPVSFAGPKRVRAPGLKIDELPKLDFVLISHSHYDHMDEYSIRELTKKFNPTFIVPLENRKLLESFGAKKIVELDWWQSTHFERAEINVVPAQHWSARGMFDRNETLWGGFIVKTDSTSFYFAGDTGYGPHFKWIAEKHPNLDLAILPIGAYEPRWFMRDQHMNPEDAVMAHLDLKAKRSLAAHFGTFQLTDESIDQPIIDLKIALKKFAVEESHFVAPKNGESFTYEF